MTTLRYIPLSGCGPILDRLQDKTFDEIKETYRCYKMLEMLKKPKPIEILFGLFILKDNEDRTVSIAVAGINKIDRIYTIPSERKKGYASKLLHEIVKFGIKNNIPYFSPVNKNVEDLFIKANWIPVMNEINKDLTSDYCHKVFHKNLIKTHPETTLEIDKSTLIELVYIMD